ncbi:MAG: DUF4129 domain-containing protein [Clostridiaceae bacterium]|nr:DUF4129 domain-containing protein [Clostridiaceae bacterium]
MKHKLGGVSGFIIGLFYTVVISGLMGTIIYDGLRFFKFFAFSLLIYGIVFLLSLSHTASRVAVISFVIAIALTVVLCFIEGSFLKAVIKEFEGLLRLWQRITNNMPINTDTSHYDEISLIVITLIASVVVLFLLNKYNSFYILSGVVFSLFFFSWFMTAIEGRLLFLIFCILTVLSYISKIYRQKLKLGLVSGDFPLGKMLLFTVPVVLIPVLIAFIIPKSDYPIQWPWLDDRINNVFTYFEQRFNYIELENFSLSSIGFSNEKTKRLGGPVSPSNIEVLKVKTKNRTYLRGAVYFWYEDSTWTRSNALAQNVNDKDINETRNGWSDIPVDEIFKYESEDDKQFLNSLASGELDMLLFPSYSIEVEIRNMITNNIFLPLKPIMPVRLANGNIMPVYELDGGIILCDSRLKRGDRYNLSYIQPMYGETLLKKALGYSGNLYENALRILSNKQIQMEKEYLSHKGPQEDNENILSELEILGRKIDRIEVLNKDSKEIYSIYTLLPDNIPARISELAHEITKGLRNDYEKTVAIEKYLRQNHTYTLSPENVPLDRDFVDYFLFDKKEGYCTYYATSMAVMLRTLGIPSRYVEGYVLPPERTSDDVYTVTNNNAHAWVEVYFEGFGWLVFEPTTIYAGTMDYRTVSSSFSGDTSMSYMDMIERYRQSQSSGQYVHSDIDPIEETEKNNYFILFCIIAGSIVFGCIIINLAIVFAKEIRLRRNKKEKIVLIRYNRMFNWLSLIGYKLNPGESPGEFAVRIDNDYNLSHSFVKITEIFSKVRYGKKSVTTEEADMVKRTYSELKKKVLKEIGIKRYLPLRIIFLGI